LKCPPPAHKTFLEPLLKFYNVGLHTPKIQLWGQIFVLTCFSKERLQRWDRLYKDTPAVLVEGMGAGYVRRNIKPGQPAK